MHCSQERECVVGIFLKDVMMTTKLNLHRLMGPDAGYLQALKVDDIDRRALSEAREAIRDTLRDAFRNWTNFVTELELRDFKAVSASDVPHLATPKFRIQGSFAYHTVNDCQNPPVQQIDQDDGVFLPLSFVTVNGKARPTIAADAYFKLVERALAPLCRQRAWTLNPLEPKNSCVRVEIGTRLHLDLPLYAIRDAAFDQLIEFAKAGRIAANDMRNSRELDERIYRELADAEIILAHRKEGWIESDPRRLETWFENAVMLYGSVVRELSRCFKGLRDAKFDDELSSICIMASVVRAIEALGGVDARRLDISLVRVAREMARRAHDPVQNPVFPGDETKHFCLGWTTDYRNKVRDLYQGAADLLERAIDGGFHKTLSVANARAAFGNRVPNDEGLISLVAAADAVRQVPVQRQPEPVVPRTKSG